MPEFIVINKTAQMKNFINISSDKVAQKFHEHIQKFIDDNNLDCGVMAQHYQEGEELIL